MEEVLGIVTDGIQPGPAAALGYFEFKVEHLKEMKGFSAEILRGFCVYYGIIGLKYYITVLAYTGKSTDANGCSGRVGEYEKAVQHADQGRFYSSATSSPFMARSIKPDVKKVWLRPVWSVPHPQDAAEYEKKEKDTNLMEGVFDDLLQTQDDTVSREFAHLMDMKIAAQAMIAYHNASAPFDRKQQYTGLNRISPWL